MLHPMASTLKGWRKLPDLDEIAALRKRVQEAIPDIQETLKVVKTSRSPLRAETEYVSLKHPDEYALYDGDIYSSDTKSSVPVDNYLDVTNEFTVAHSTASGRSGTGTPISPAPWRVNNNFDQLQPEAKQAAEDLGFKAPATTPT